MERILNQQHEAVFELDLPGDRAALVSAEPPLEIDHALAWFRSRLGDWAAAEDREAMLTLPDRNRLNAMFARADAWETEFRLEEGDGRIRCELDLLERDGSGIPARLRLRLRDLSAVFREVSGGGNRALLMEAVCRTAITAHYEETDLVDTDTWTVCPLLDRGGFFYRAGSSDYVRGLRALMRQVPGDSDRAALALLLPENLVPALKEKGSRTVRFRLTGEDGAPMWKEVECSGFRAGSVLLLVSDIQKEEDVKERLREAAGAAMAASKAKSAFLANMSHEIRTPMNAIVGISEVLLRKDLPEDVHTSLSTIQNSGNSLLSIINDILDFSKIETGKFEITEVDYMLPSLLMDISNVISVRLASQPVYFMMDLDPSLPNHFLGDDIRLKQILMNLLGNAVKFTREGFIELTVRGERLEGDRFRLTFAVRDTGIGIKQEDMGKLFQTFSQVDTRRNRATTGSGLGLAISRNLASLMGGDLTVESVYGQGSTFTCTVVHRITRYQPLGEVRDKSARILICEQNENIVRNLSRTMENLGLPYEVCREIDRIRDYGDMTHILIRRKFFGRVREKLKFMFHHSNILLILDNDEQAEGDYMDYRQLQLPLITFQLINALNGEEIVSSIKKKTFDRSQIIPLTYAHVLVVDDNTTNLQVAKGLMLPYRMKIDTASSGFDAIEMVKRTRYDVVFMDHMMPEMDGIETAKYIRNLEGDYFREVPIIALTANAMSDAREQFLEAGMNDFVAKPIEMQELHRVIKQYIQARAPEGYMENITRQLAAEARAPEQAASAGDGRTAPAPEGKGGAVPAPGNALPGGEVLRELLVQNNSLLSQNMLLLKALLGEPETPAAPAESAPGEAAPAAAALPENTEEAPVSGDEEIRDIIPGVDMRKSIDIYGGSVSVYHNILKTYYYDIREKEDLLRRLFEARDIENFTIQVHALKSASRGVGAFDLGEEAWQLEQAGKAGDWRAIEAGFPQLAARLRDMVRNVGAYAEQYLLPPAEETGDRERREAFDPDQVRRLKEACEEMDYMEAEAVLEEMAQAAYPEDLGKTLEELRTCCGAFDYDRLEELVGTL